MKHTFFLLLFITASVFAQETTLNKLFESKVYHFSMQYPNTWQCHARDQGIVVCKNVIHASYPLSVNIQTLYTKKGGGKYVDVKALMDDFFIQVPMHTAKAHFLDRKPIVLVQPDGEKLYGEETTLTFSENDQRFKQWQVMVVSGDGQLFHAWAYRAPEKYYETNKSLASAMLSSWVIFK